MKHIPLVKPEFDAKKLCRDFQKIAKSGTLTKGPFLAKFEKQLADYLPAKHVFATSSCTTALHLALVASGIKSGDEVLVSDFSFPASGNVVSQIGAVPVFIDIDLKTLCLNIDDLKTKITKKSKAIMVVHAFGYPANMSGIMQIAKKNNLLVIEDAACALGSAHKNKKLGNWGDIGCFSFHPRKNITTGEGGAVVTNDSKIAQKINIFRNHGGIQKNNKWEFVEIGYNYRLSELQAALGVQQMPKLDKIIQKRQKVVQKYLKLLKGLPGVSLSSAPSDGSFNFQSFVIILDKKYNRDEVINKLRSYGIESVLGTYAMHALPSYKKYGYNPGDLPNSFLAYRQSLTLPLYSQMTGEEIKYVADSLKSILDKSKYKNQNDKSISNA